MTEPPRDTPMPQLMSALEKSIEVVALLSSEYGRGIWWMAKHAENAIRGELAERGSRGLQQP